MDKRQQIEVALNTAMKIDELSKHPIFVEIIHPALEKKSTVQGVDPTTYKTKEEYEYALDRANVEALAYRQVLNFFIEQEANIMRMRKQLLTMPKNEQPTATPRRNV